MKRIIASSPGCGRAAGRPRIAPCPAASRGRYATAGARHRRRATRRRSHRAGRRPPRRTAGAARGSAVCTSCNSPVSGSTTGSTPTSGSSSSRGSTTSMASTSCRTPQLTQRPAPLRGRCEEVRDHHGQPTAARRPVEQVHQRAQVAAPGSQRGVRHRAQQRLRLPPAGAGRHPGQHPGPAGGVGPVATGGRARAGLRPGADHRADPVAAAHGQVGQRGGRGDHHVPLEPPAGAEVQARRQVHRQPGLQLPVGHRTPHVRRGGAGGDRPVHPAYVVAGAVLAGLPRLAARPRQQTRVVALEQAVELAGDQQLQPGQHRLVRAPHRRRRGVPVWSRPLTGPAAGRRAADRRRRGRLLTRGAPRAAGWSTSPGAPRGRRARRRRARHS